MRRRRVLVLTGAAAAVAAARPALGQAPLERLQLIAIPSDALTHLYWGLKNELFQRAGIDLQIVPASSGTAATTAVVTGNYEIANTSLLPIFTAHLRGIPIGIVAPQALYTPENPFSLLQIAADAPYKTAADLNGKICACAALNDAAQLSTMAWVDKHGGDSSSLKFVEIPNSALDQAIVSHRVACGTLLEPALDESIAAGHTKTLGDAWSALGNKFMFAAYVGREDWARAHADLLRRFVRVAGEAANYTNAHPEATAAMMSEVTKVPLPIMQRMKRVACATTMDPALVQPMIDGAAKYKMIAQKFPAKDILFTGA